MNKLQADIIEGLKEFYGEDLYVPESMSVEEAAEFIIKHDSELTEAFDEYFGGGLFIAGKLIVAEGQYSAEEFMEAIGADDEMDTMTYFDIDFNCYDYYTINNFKLNEEQLEDQRKKIEEMNKKFAEEERQMLEYEDYLAEHAYDDLYDGYDPGDDFVTDWIRSLE